MEANHRIVNKIVYLERERETHTHTQRQEKKVLY